MIKIPYSISELDAIAKIYYREIKAELQLSVNLSAWPLNDELKPVMIHLHNNLDTIITGRPDVLEDQIIKIEPLIAQAKIDYKTANPNLVDAKGNFITDQKKIDSYVDNWAKDAIKKVFNYDSYQYTSFTGKRKGELAYRHARRLQVNSCPYCNSNFTFTIKSKRGKSRPEFDHFLSKGMYPYLALSFYNLIPSCPVCNSSGLKGQKPFSIKTHLHPFIDSMEGLYRFRTNIDAVDFILKGDKFSILMRPVKGAIKVDRKRAKTSIESFAINDRYKFHKDYAEEILRKAYFYDKSTIKDLFTAFEIGGKSIFSSENEIKELIMGNYLHPDNLHRRVLSKLAKDIAEEFGITIK